MGNIRRMFFGGNTSNGFYSFHNYIISENRKKLYILKGMPGGGKSSLMKRIGEYLSKQGFTVEFHHCPSDPDSLDSIFITEKRIAIADGTSPHIMDPVYPGLTDEIIDLAQFIDRNMLKNYEDEIINAKSANKRAYFNAFSYLKSLRHIHDIIVERNRQGVDFEGINAKTKLIIEEIFSEKEKEIKDIVFTERHAFTAANSPKGLADYTDTVLEGIKRIYYIKGEKGTGKSTIIKKIYDEAKIRGFILEVYHDPTFPEKIETLNIKELDTCITYNRNGEKYATNIIDLSEHFDERVINNSDYELYSILMEKATLSLMEAKNNHHIMEKKYIPTIDYSKIDKVRESLLKEIISL